ncbi:unnamed protein product [Coregonus sp. 'balchen']|nr:unnamed protein product [Coregonus sp. 'balchen']
MDSVPETSYFDPHSVSLLQLLQQSDRRLPDQHDPEQLGTPKYGGPWLGCLHPSRILTVETSAVLHSLQTIPEFAEILKLIDSDPVAWSEFTSFSLKEMTSPLKQEVMASVSQVAMPEGASYHFDDSAIIDLSKSYTELMPASSPTLTMLSTPPFILKRRRRRERGEQSPASECHSTSFLDNSASSPRLTPVKALPFSPSQFFNVSEVEDLTLDNPALTSTPARGHKRANTTPLHKDLTHKHRKENAGTPKAGKAVMLPMPLTPTPFKIATATQEKMQGQLKMMMQQPQSLAYLEEEVDASSRRVRKSLAVEPWSKDCQSAQLYSQEHLNIHGESLMTNAPLRSSMLGCEELNRGALTGPSSQTPGCASRTVVL